MIVDFLTNEVGLWAKGDEKCLLFGAVKGDLIRFSLKYFFSFFSLRKVKGRDFKEVLL